jgi:hypothetical protein
MRDKIFLCPGIAKRRANDFAGGHLKVCNEGLCALPGVLKLMQFQLAFGHGMVWMDPLQGLNARLFVNTDHVYAGFMQRLGLVIVLAYRSDLLPKARLIFDFVIQPIFNSVRF